MRLPANNLGVKNAVISANKSSASNMRPRPISPQAWSPLSGPKIAIPSSFNCTILRCVAGFSHICLFIAGATNKGQFLAKHNVDSKSSARPCTNLAINSAEAGAIKIASASRLSSMCGMPFAIEESHIPINTGLPDNACMVIGVINLVADSVITTVTSKLALTNRRTSSADLYAAMPPVIPSTTLPNTNCLSV